MTSNIFRNAAATLGAVAVIAVIGAAPASADNNDWCMTGPFGYAQACVNLPGWYLPDWDYGPGWRGGWHHGGHHGWNGEGD